jgi:hypothetical protein
MEATLHQDLIAAQFDRLLYFVVQSFARQQIGVGVTAFPKKCAKVTFGRADIRVVYVAIDVVCAIRFRMHPSRDAVRGAAEGRQVVGLRQRDTFVARDSFALNALLQDWADR